MNVFHININYSLRPLHQELVRALGKIGVKNEVFVPISDVQSCKVEIDDNVLIKECFKKFDRLFFSRKQKKILAAAKDEFSKQNYEIIHAHTLFTDGNVAMELSDKSGIPYIVAVRNTDVNIFFKYRPWLIPLGMRIMDRASQIIFLSEAYKNTVINGYVPKHYRERIFSKSTVIPNGIDQFWLDNMRAPKAINLTSKLNLLSVCEVDKNKNIAETIKAIKLLRDKGYDCKLAVVGRIKDKKISREIVNEEFVFYYKPIPKHELINLYDKADIFVMPSHTESFGLVYAEALSQGLPVIYTRGQGFDGQFVEGKVGYAVSDKDPEEIVGAVLRIVSNYTQISANAIEGCQRFSWNLIADMYKDIYGGILNEPEVGFQGRA